MSNIYGKHLSVLKYGTVSTRPKYYLAAAVNRFLRPEPFNISNDPPQDSVAESVSGGDGHTTDVRKDESDKTTCQLNASLPALASEKTQNTEIKARKQLNDYAAESVAMFCSLSLREKTTVTLENSSGLKTQDKMKNADALLLASDRAGNCHTEDQLEVGSQPEEYEDEDNLSEDNQPTDKQKEQDSRRTTADVNREENIQSHTTEMHTNVNGQSDAMTSESEQVGTLEEELFSVDNSDRCEEEVAGAVPVKPEAKTAQEIGKAFKKMPLRVCDTSQQLHTSTCKEPLPEHNNETFPDGNKTQEFLEVEKSEEMQSHGHLQEEAESIEQKRLQNGSGAKRRSILAGETKATCWSSNMGARLPQRELGAPCYLSDDDVEALQEEIEVVEVEQPLRLYEAAGDSNEARREMLGFSRDEEWMVEVMGVESNLTGSSLAQGEMKPERCAVEDARNDARKQDQRSEEVTKDVITQVILDAGIRTPSPEENFDSKRDELSNESLEKHYDMESFTVISSPELGFSDQSLGESMIAACAREAARASTAFAVEQANDQEVLEMNSLHIQKTDSEESPVELSRYSGEPLKTKILHSLDKVDKPECEVEGSSFVLNFAPQRSRIAVKNPRLRPPKDRHSLLQRPSVDPVSAPAPPASKISVGVNVLGGLGFAIKLPGLGAGFVKKQPKMEAELKPVPEADVTIQAEVPPKPKWMPPRQAGFGNPFMSELKTKLKKATKN